MKIKKIWFVNFLLLACLLAADFVYIFTSYSQYITKTIASALFVVIALVNVAYLMISKKKNTVYNYIMLAGLIFAMMGDIFLIDHFILGAILFAIGHILFFVAFCVLKGIRIWDFVFGLGIFGITLLVLFLYPNFNFENMLVIILAYAFIISMMLGKAISNIFVDKNWRVILIAIGAALFFISDMFLVFAKFGGGSFVCDLFCLLTYYPAEGILALSILFTNVKIKE